jgi:hypothetical protein
LVFRAKILTSSTFIYIQEYIISVSSPPKASVEEMPSPTGAVTPTERKQVMMASLSLVHNPK